ncbi:unnamed protein product [Gadus morhua 'NCC']
MQGLQHDLYFGIDKSLEGTLSAILAVLKVTQHTAPPHHQHHHHHQPPPPLPPLLSYSPTTTTAMPMTTKIHPIKQEASIAETLRSARATQSHSPPLVSCNEDTSPLLLLVNQGSLPSTHRQGPSETASRWYVCGGRPFIAHAATSGNLKQSRF